MAKFPVYRLFCRFEVGQLNQIVLWSLIGLIPIFETVVSKSTRSEARVHRFVRRFPSDDMAIVLLRVSDSMYSVRRKRSAVQSSSIAT